MLGGCVRKQYLDKGQQTHMLNCARENFKVGFVLTKFIGHIKVTVGNIDITERSWSVQFVPASCKLQVNSSLQYPH